MSDIFIKSPIEPSPAPAPPVIAPVTPVSGSSAPRTVSLSTCVLSVVIAALLSPHLGFMVPAVELVHANHRLGVVLDWSGGVTPPIPFVPPAPPAPVKAEKLRVLFLYDGTATKTRDQEITLGSTVIRGYLDGQCARDSDGRPAWRFWDKATDVSHQSPEWQAAMKAALADAGLLPKMLVFDGSTLVKSYPVTNEAEAVAALKTWGGNR